MYNLFCNIAAKLVEKTMLPVLTPTLKPVKTVCHTPRPYQLLPEDQEEY